MIYRLVCFVPLFLPLTAYYELQACPLCKILQKLKSIYNNAQEIQFQFWVQRRHKALFYEFSNKIDSNLIQHMAKGKTKKIQKEEKAERNVDAPDTESKRTFSSDHDIFSEAFKQKVSQFVRLTQEVLTLKGTVEGSNQSDQIARRRNELSERVEQAATQILKDQISSIESWIGEQQVKYSEEKERIVKAYEENRASLLATGSFSEDEVRNHLINVQKKADEKQATYDNYATLLQRCQNIYK